MSVEHWEAYYRGGAIATCPMGPGTTYTLELRDLWLAFFAALDDGGRVLDVGTGNGAITLLAKEAATAAGRHLEIHGADLAAIDPPRHVPNGASLFAGIAFHAGVPCERLGFADGSFDAVSGQYDTIILGYGMCSMAIVGIQAHGCRLVVPRVDDCISIFLGSRSAYTTQCHTEPGTYYLTKGWIEVGDTPFAEHDRLIQRYGKERAERMMQLMLANYKRLALIDTGQYELERYREYARRAAERFNLRFEEIEGSNALVKKMIYGPWDDEFVVVPAGEAIRYEHFFRL